MSALIECVPNFAEGRRLETVDRLAAAVSAVPGAQLLDRSSDPDHNRSVLTFAGEPDAVEQALLAAAAVAVEEIDLRTHRGAHPRIGALDVAPFVPLGDASWPLCIDLARRCAERLWSELGVPVYFYGRAARRPDREQLENIRRGGFEALRLEALEDPARRPDIGGPGLHLSAGACAVGVRGFLIAFNVNLETRDPAAARRIARCIRESAGGLPAVKALGLELPTQGLTQVSVNLTDFEQTPLQTVFDRISELAAAEGVAIACSELIGLIPRRALEPPGADYLRIRDFRPAMILENRLS
jgi:glutamate formiminotransferase/glutamate formiminotransferase/formiminotetrahydrofolate cyclodeaminase